MRLSRGRTSQLTETRSRTTLGCNRRPRLRAAAAEPERLSRQFWLAVVCGMAHLGAHLERAFTANMPTGISGEVALFRALLAALGAVAQGALGREYHGTRSHVRFQATRGAGRSLARCELADLLLISYRSGAPTSVRMTWLQAKLTKSPLPVCLAVATSSSGYAVVWSQPEQWDLLGNRPSLVGATTKFRPPGDLLSAAILPSVGSFGVFYPCYTGYDMAYFIDDCLGPLRNNAGRSGTLTFTSVPAVRAYHGFREVTMACCLSNFGDAIEQELVGMPVTALLSGRAPASAVRREWLQALLTDLLAEHPDSALATEVLSMLDLQASPPEKPVAAGIGARAVVLLRYERRHTQLPIP
jgi:hypothetical protein